MKKLLSLCLAVVMMVCLLAGMTINATEGAGGTGAAPSAPANEYYTLRRENFGIAYQQASSTGWSTQSIGTAMQNAGCFKMRASASDYGFGTVAVARAADNTITSNIYIDTPGTYTAYMYVEQSGWAFDFAIDGQSTTAQFGTTVNLRPEDSDTPTNINTEKYFFAMEKADRTWTLGEGWHTVSVTSATASGKFQTVFITNDTDLDPANITYVSSNTGEVVDSKVNMRAFEDFTAPDAGTLVATANTADEQKTSVTLTWNGATDASGIAKYEIHNGTEYVDVTNETSYVVNDLWAASDYTFKLRVTDYFNYTTETTATVRTNGSPDTDGPQWPADAGIEVVNRSYSSIITWEAAADNRGVAGYEIYEDTVDEANLIASVDAEATSYTIYLNQDDEKDIVLVARDIGGLLSDELTASVASTERTENYTIRRENFGIVQGVKGDWETKNVGTAMQMSGCFYMNSSTSAGLLDYGFGCAAQARAAGASISADIYVEEAGTYTVFMMAEQSGYGLRFGINGQEATTRFGANLSRRPSDAEKYSEQANYFAWEKADRTWELEAGWNTITVTATANAGMFEAILLTDSIDMEIDELTYLSGSDKPAVSEGKLNIAFYEDFTGPVFGSGEIGVEYNAEANTVTLEWPAATGVQAYKVLVNDKAIGRTEDSVTVSFEINATNLEREIVKGEWLDIKVVAVDSYSNASEKTLSYKVSKFVVDGETDEATGVTISEVDGDLVASANITNVSVDDANFRLSIAIYDANGEIVAKDVLYDTIVSGNGDTYTVTITDAPDTTTYTVKAHLWDADDLTSIVATETMAPAPAEAE